MALTVKDFSPILKNKYYAPKRKMAIYGLIKGLKCPGSKIRSKGRGRGLGIGGGMGPIGRMR